LGQFANGLDEAAIGRAGEMEPIGSTAARKKLEIAD